MFRTHLSLKKNVFTESFELVLFSKLFTVSVSAKITPKGILAICVRLHTRTYHWLTFFSMNATPTLSEHSHIDMPYEILW